jgi:hypothetical protein
MPSVLIMTIVMVVGVIHMYITRGLCGGEKLIKVVSVGTSLAEAPNAAGAMNVTVIIVEGTAKESVFGLFAVPTRGISVTKFKTRGIGKEMAG